VPRRKGFEAVLQIRGLDHVVIRSARPERLVAFYRDVLGCPVERETAPGLGLVQLRAGHSLIDIVAVDSRLGRMGGRAPDGEGRNLDHFCVVLETFDELAIRSHLSRHGIAAGDAVQRYGAGGFGLSIYIEDPDGNTIELKAPAVPG
jgi:glyoxylase I family protein